MTFDEYFLHIFRPDLSFSRLQSFTVLSLRSERLARRTFCSDLHCVMSGGGYHAMNGHSVWGREFWNGGDYQADQR
jgi:hypothetical protein